MADLAWPEALPPQTMVWSIQKSGAQFRSPYAGSVESVTFPGWFWRISVTLKPRRSRDLNTGLAEAFFENLAGGDDAVLVYNWLRPVPRGTMRGTPTVQTAAVRGDRFVILNTPGNLEAGDLFKIGNTVFKASQRAGPITGVMVVPIVGRVRVPIAPGATVTWDRPTVRCIMPSMSHSSAFRPGIMEGVPVDLEEAPA